MGQMIDYTSIHDFDRAIFFLQNRIENALIDYTLMNEGFQPHVHRDLEPTPEDVLAFATGSREYARDIRSLSEDAQMNMVSELYDFWFLVDEFESYLPDNENTRSREHREYGIEAYTALCHDYIRDKQLQDALEAIMAGVPSKDVLA